MSLATKIKKNAKMISYIAKCDSKMKIDQKNINDGVCYLEPDDLPEGIKNLKQIRLTEKNECFFPVVTNFSKENEQVDHIYVVGPAGSGKSTWAHNYSIVFHKMYPKSKILLFSSKKSDELLDKLKFVTRFDIDDDVLTSPFTLEELKEMSCPILCIFDDVQDFQSRKITLEIGRFRDEVLRNGRSYGIFCLYIYHDPCDYKSTKAQIFESTKVVLFPKDCGKGTYDYLLNKKLHLNKEMIKYINDLNSNWVCVNKKKPQYIMSDRYIILDS